MTFSLLFSRIFYIFTETLFILFEQNHSGNQKILKLEGDFWTQDIILIKDYSIHNPFQRYSIGKVLALKLVTTLITLKYCLYVVLLFHSFPIISGYAPQFRDVFSLDIICVLNH